MAASPDAAAICNRHASDKVAPHRPSRYGGCGLALPVFCNTHQLAAPEAEEWRRYLLYVYGGANPSFTFPLDTRGLAQFYTGQMLPKAVATALIRTPQEWQPSKAPYASL